MNRTLKFLPALALTVLAGCAQLQAKFNSDVQILTEPDLQAAVALAASNPNPVHGQCYAGLLAGVQALNTTAPASASVQPAGIISAAEALMQASDQIAPITLPKLAPGVDAACKQVIGELVVDGSTAAIRAQAAVAATLHAIK